MDMPLDRPSESIDWVPTVRPDRLYWGPGSGNNPDAEFTNSEVADPPRFTDAAVVLPDRHARSTNSRPTDEYRQTAWAAAVEFARREHVRNDAPPAGDHGDAVRQLGLPDFIHDQVERLGVSIFEQVGTWVADSVARLAADALWPGVGSQVYDGVRGVVSFVKGLDKADGFRISVPVSLGTKPFGFELWTEFRDGASDLRSSPFGATLKIPGPSTLLGTPSVTPVTAIPPTDVVIEPRLPTLYEELMWYQNRNSQVRSIVMMMGQRSGQSVDPMTADPASVIGRATEFVERKAQRRGMPTHAVSDVVALDRRRLRWIGQVEQTASYVEGNFRYGFVRR
jgi:hypothetical protein